MVNEAINDWHEQSDSLLHYDTKYWFDHSIGNNIQLAYNTVHPIAILRPHMYSEHVKVQRILCKHLVQQSSAKEVIPKLVHKLCFFVSASSANDVAPKIQQHMCAQSGKLPNFVLVAFLKSITNSWTTRRRFGANGPCPFCQCNDGSDIKHLLSCKEVHEVSAKFLKQWNRWPAQGGIQDSIGLQLNPGSEVVAIQMLWHDILLQAFHAKRHGSNAPLYSIFAARIRVICRSSPSSKRLLREAFRGQV